jgi:hypothetical protein
MKLGSWLHSISRSRTWSGSSRVECLRPMEMKKMSFSIRRLEWPSKRVVGEYGDIYRALSKN